MISRWSLSKSGTNEQLTLCGVTSDWHSVQEGVTYRDVTVSEWLGVWLDTERGGDEKSWDLEQGIPDRREKAIAWWGYLCSEELDRGSDIYNPTIILNT